MVIQNIEKIMKEKGITAYKLEKDTGIKQATFQGWKRGSQPAADKIEIILKYLNVSANTIFGITEQELTEQEQELLTYFRALEPTDQARELGRLEAKAEAQRDAIRKTEQERLLSSRTG